MFNSGRSARSNHLGEKDQSQFQSGNLQVDQSRQSELARHSEWFVQAVQFGHYRKKNKKSMRLLFELHV